MEMRLTVVHTGEGQLVESATPSGNMLTFDGEGGAKGATPMEHLLSALGACSLMDVAHILRKKRLAFSNLRVECVGARPDEGHPKPFEGVTMRFTVEGDVPQKVFDDAVRLSAEKYCNVGATLKRAPPVAIEAHVEA